jgi:predicted nucleic acid-binding Zn ribbon protein
MTWISEVLRRYNLEPEFQQQQALLLWPKVVGPQVARFAEAVRVERGVLWVETASATVAQELAFLKEHYLQALNAEVGEKQLLDLRFIPGRVSPVKEQKSLAEPSPAARRRASEAVEEVDDPLLRAALQRLYASLDKTEPAGA